MNKKEVITKEDLEKYYNECRKIKFKNEDKENYKSLLSIFKNIHDPNYSLATTYTRGGHHCYSCKIRSIDDYINLCKYYFPNSTLKEICTTIVEYVKNHKKEYPPFRLYYCPNIRKTNLHNNYYFDKKHVLEILLKTNFYRQGFKNCNIAFKEIIE